jgi:hypothetical protein
MVYPFLVGDRIVHALPLEYVALASNRFLILVIGVPSVAAANVTDSHLRINSPSKLY